MSNHGGATWTAFKTESEKGEFEKCGNEQRSGAKRKKIARTATVKGATTTKTVKVSTPSPSVNVESTRRRHQISSRREQVSAIVCAHIGFARRFASHFHQVCHPMDSCLLCPSR